jgi:hypothetical protein
VFHRDPEIDYRQIRAIVQLRRASAGRPGAMDEPFATRQLPAAKCRSGSKSDRLGILLDQSVQKSRLHTELIDQALQLNPGSRIAALMTLGKNQFVF